MSHDIFKKQLDWATGHGLYLNPKLERKAVNGLFGMYATGSIRANELLASFPEKELLTSKVNSIDDEPDSKVAVVLSWMLAAAREMTNLQSSSYAGIFAGFERLEDMRGYSFYFFSDKELELLKMMSPLLLRWVMNAKQKADSTIKRLKGYDSSYDFDLLLTIYLNCRSRGFYPQCVVPVLDQFNHSDRLGQQNIVEDGCIKVFAKQNCNSGEQVFISYGPKDLYTHAIHYNYFDPEGPHYIEFARKTLSAVRSSQDEALLAHLKQFFEVTEFNSNGTRGFFVSDSSVLINDDGPSTGLFTYLKESVRLQIGPYASEQALMEAALELFVILIDRQIQMNHVDQIDEKLIPNHLQRFYKLLKKERKMLLSCRANALSLIQGRG